MGGGSSQFPLTKVALDAGLVCGFTGVQAQDAAALVAVSTLKEVMVSGITDAGKPHMQIPIKKGEKIERYQSHGEIGEGEGAKADIAYRMKDGGIVYVPE